MKMAVFWNVAACSPVVLTDVSEELTTSFDYGNVDEHPPYYTVLHSRRQPSSYL
jgi:hypothetical protein